jgi:VIT1/CCC1 family predicted Fe2+/Mn2+ transporter
MPKKSADELQRELELRETLEKERAKSDDKYAIKLVEKIVLGLLAAFGLTVVGVLAKVFSDYLSQLTK